MASVTEIEREEHTEKVSHKELHTLSSVISVRTHTHPVLAVHLILSPTQRRNTCCVCVCDCVNEGGECVFVFLLASNYRYLPGKIDFKNDKLITCRSKCQLIILIQNKAGT